MAKISRRMLKGLIKECLVEILQEGLDFGDVITERAVKPKRKTDLLAGLGYDDRQSHQPKRKHPILDASVTREASPPRLSNSIHSSIANVSSDPTMQALLEDTAQNMLPYQDQAENHRGSAPQSDIPLDALELMGAKSSTWETLAFTNLPDSGRIKLE